MPRSWLCSVCVFAGLASAPVARAGVVYNEPVDGEISGDRLAPTSITLGGVGDNFVVFAVSLGDLDFFTVTIPSGLAVSELVLTDYESDDPVAFLAFMPGAEFNDDTDFPNPALYSGLAHFGANELGLDLFPSMQAGLGFPVLGFPVPLPAGQYTFWVQQIGAITSIGLNFVTIPGPSAFAGVGLGWLVARSGRRR